MSQVRRAQAHALYLLFSTAEPNYVASNTSVLDLAQRRGAANSRPFHCARGKIALKNYAPILGDK